MVLTVSLIPTLPLLSSLTDSFADIRLTAGLGDEIHFLFALDHTSNGAGYTIVLVVNQGHDSF
jgi:hypothetical protein